MNSSIGAGVLVLIFLFIVFLFRLRKKRMDDLRKFYDENQIYSIEKFPDIIRDALGNGYWRGAKGSLVIEHKPFEFYWMEGSIETFMTINNSTQAHRIPYLSIIFPPKTVSEDFMEAAYRSMKSASKFKDFFILNTTVPIRIENLADGSFLMMWKVFYKAEIYQQKLDWLQTNLS